MQTDKLFYDANCNLCRREIQWLRRLKKDSLTLINIHDTEIVSGNSEHKQSELLSILHLKRSDGGWLTGLDAMVGAWRHTSVGWLLAPLRWPLIKQVTDILYNRWAQRRACRLGYKNQY